MAKVNLVELYTEFSRIDLDARGGYARVADVVARQADGRSVYHAFKLMRHELDDKSVGMQRFENELRILIEITSDKNAPAAITKMYDSGFAPVELSHALHNLHPGERLSPNLELISTGTDLKKFLEEKSALMDKEPDRWLPYLVVELAPFDDCLLRQINPQSACEKLDLYRLPVHTIIKMALQLLDVLDYLHKKLRCVYTDWKPEHIYWNEAAEQLKLIDWNVTNRLRDSSRERQLIREDLRMFCGAALYCSLALTDPEDLTRAIGPTPTIPRDRVPLIPPRYWTDRPNFYQRDAILDEEIKRIVQKGLDPKQGFNSPTELRNELIEYAAQLKRQKNVQSDEQKNLDLIASLPQEAVQIYRRARSYIAAEDYSLAALSLETAVETAKLAGMKYPDAEKVLESVQNILQAGEFREKVKLSLQLGEWDAALNQYKKAIEHAPTNTSMRQEYECLRQLRHLESRLRNKYLFINTLRVQTALESIKDILDAENPLYISMQKQLKRIQALQFRGVFTLLVVAFLGLAVSGKLGFPGLIPVATPTATPTFNHTPTQAPIPTSTPTLVSPTPEPFITFTATVTPTVTITSEPTATVTTVLNYGILNVAFFYPVNKPNGARTGVSLEIDQFVMIVESAVDREQLWYKCVWEKDGVAGDGWILGENIQFVPPPTATLTPTP